MTRRIRPLTERDVSMAAHPRTGRVVVLASRPCLARGCTGHARGQSPWCADCERHIRPDPPRAA